MSNPIPGLVSPPAIVRPTPMSDVVLQEAHRLSAQKREIARHREELEAAKRVVRKSPEFKVTAEARARLKAAKEKALDVPEVRDATSRLTDARRDLSRTPAAAEEQRLMELVTVAEAEHSLGAENFVTAVDSGEIGSLNRPRGLVLPRDRVGKDAAAGRD